MDDDSQRQLMLQMALASAEPVEIPPDFFSEETRRPFERCIDCGLELLLPPSRDDQDHPPLNADDDRDGDMAVIKHRNYYHIHKTIVRNEAVFEFAMCLNCNEKLQAEFSAETREAIQRFCVEEIVPPEQDELQSVDDWLSACVVCRKPRSECDRYAISAFAAEANLLLGTGPFLMCDDCESGMSELVSEKTRRCWDRFVEEHFDGPPGIEADWPSIPALV